MDEPSIGELRWRVTLFRRAQEPDSTGPGIAETMIPIGEAWAKVQPLGAVTFYAAAQTETPVTHRIFIRWRAGLDTTHAVERITRSQDGTAHRELFRVRRQSDLAGRKRFLVLEAELESRA